MHDTRPNYHDACHRTALRLNKFARKTLHVIGFRSANNFTSICLAFEGFGTKENRK